MSVSAYPLTWPHGFPRSKAREAGRFNTSLHGALKNVEDSLRRFAVDSGKEIKALVISSNVTLGAQNPPDPGVAVWFTWDGLQVCIPVDRYSRVEGNLQAIHHIIEARRVELRHGTLALVRATFTGFKALPDHSESWRAVLGCGSGTVTLAHAEDCYRRRRSEAHPDRGGRPEDFDRVEKAWQRARAELAP